MEYRVTFCRCTEYFLALISTFYSPTTLSVRASDLNMVCEYKEMDFFLRDFRQILFTLKGTRFILKKKKNQCSNAVNKEKMHTSTNYKIKSKQFFTLNLRNIHKK